MTTFHAVLRIDHQSAEVLQFDAEHLESQRIKAHTHHTAQHASGVRSEHEFYAAVCEALDGIAEVLVAGSKTALADFRHYAEKHRPALVPHLVGYEAIDHPKAPQLVAMARKFFLRYDRMAGTPTPA